MFYNLIGLFANSIAVRFYINILCAVLRTPEKAESSDEAIAVHIVLDTVYYVGILAVTGNSA